MDGETRRQHELRAGADGESGRGGTGEAPAARKRGGKRRGAKVKKAKAAVAPLDEACVREMPSSSTLAPQPSVASVGATPTSAPGAPHPYSPLTIERVTTINSDLSGEPTGSPLALGPPPPAPRPGGHSPTLPAPPRAAAGASADNSPTLSGSGRPRRRSSSHVLTDASVGSGPAPAGAASPASSAGDALARSATAPTDGDGDLSSLLKSHSTPLELPPAAGHFQGVAIAGSFSRRKRDSLQSSRSCDVSPRSLPSRPPTTSPAHGSSASNTAPAHLEDSAENVSPISIPRAARGLAAGDAAEPRGSFTSADVALLPTPSSTFHPSPIVGQRGGAPPLQGFSLGQVSSPSNASLHILSPTPHSALQVPLSPMVAGGGRKPPDVIRQSREFAPDSGPAQPPPPPPPPPCEAGAPEAASERELSTGTLVADDEKGGTFVSTAPMLDRRRSDSLVPLGNDVSHLAPAEDTRRGRGSSASDAFLSTHASTHIVTPADFALTHTSWVSVDSDGEGADAKPRPRSPTLSTMSAEERVAAQLNVSFGRAAAAAGGGATEPGGSSLRVSDSPHSPPNHDAVGSGAESEELEPKRLFDDDSLLGRGRRGSRASAATDDGALTEPMGGSFCNDAGAADPPAPGEADPFAPAPPVDPQQATGGSASGSGFLRRLGGSSGHNTTSSSLVQPLNESLVGCDGADGASSVLSPEAQQLTPYANLYSAQDLQFEDYESDSDDEDVSMIVFGGATPSLSLLAQKFRQKVFHKVVVVVGPYASLPPRAAEAPGGLADAKLLTLELDRVRNGDVRDLLATMGIGALREAFDEAFYRANPGVLCNIWREYWPTNSPKQIHLTHVLCKLLHERDLLLRAYTPSLDGLLRVVGVPRQKVVELGGTFSASRCIDCGKEHMSTYMKEKLFRHQRPTCTFKPCKGLVKPDILFTQQKHPPPHVAVIGADLEECDLLMVIGVAEGSDHPQQAAIQHIVDGVSDTVPRLYLRPTRETAGDDPDAAAPPAAASSATPPPPEENYRDVSVDHTTERGVAEFCKFAGLEFSMRKLVPMHIAKRFDALMADLDLAGIVRSAPKVKGGGVLKATVLSRAARQISEIAAAAQPRPAKSPLARAPHPKKIGTPKAQSPSKLGLVSDFNRTICSRPAGGSGATPGRSSSAGQGAGGRKNLRPEPTSAGVMTPSRGLKPLSAPPGSTFVHQARVRFNNVFDLIDDGAGTVEAGTLDGTPAPALRGTPAPARAMPNTSRSNSPQAKDAEATPHSIPRPPKHPRRSSKD
eukprot:TRINITY_DN12532_c0_g1_i3.p1 TRINITY_DN12532_c0_g1~~TRINITY_DN12532_c0_g1_i3.p1  ORF type:complete len:1272 (+),score=390.59 TRINITY_DN12532_c0_g1_i3:134-3949(+)